MCHSMGLAVANYCFPTWILSRQDATDKRQDGEQPELTSRWHVSNATW